MRIADTITIYNVFSKSNNISQDHFDWKSNVLRNQSRGNLFSHSLQQCGTILHHVSPKLANTPENHEHNFLKRNRFTSQPSQRQDLSCSECMQANPQESCAPTLQTLRQKEPRQNVELPGPFPSPVLAQSVAYDDVSNDARLLLEAASRENSKTNRLASHD